jgi:hypothetical protein
VALYEEGRYEEAAAHRTSTDMSTHQMGGIINTDLAYDYELATAVAPVVGGGMC